MKHPFNTEELVTYLELAHFILEYDFEAAVEHLGIDEDHLKKMQTKLDNFMNC